MKILILGGNGMIGHKMYQVISKQITDTWITIRRDKRELGSRLFFNSGKIIDNIELSNLVKLKEVLNKLQPDVIINAAGITTRRGIGEMVSNYVIINTVLPHFLNEWVNSNQKKLIHFSTDCVFSGHDGLYAENDFTNASDLYGRTKALGEVLVSPNTLTLRGSMIGRELENKTELLEWFLKQGDKDVKGFSEVIYAGITSIRMAVYVSDIIVRLPQMHGLYNVSSFPISKYNLITLFNNTFHVNASLVSDGSYSSGKDLVSDRFFTETGFVKPRWSGLITELKADSDSNLNFYQ